MSTLKKLVIIGGGFAGLRALYKLSDYDYHFEITLIDSNNFSLEKPALPEVAMENKDESEVKIILPPVARKSKAAFIQDEVEKIDASNQKIFLKSGKELEYDYLLIASGAVKDYDAIKGYKEFGYSVCDNKEAKRLHEKLKDFQGGAIVTGAAKSEFGTLIDAPNLKAPCEGPIGEIMFMMDHKLRKEKLREKSSITVFSPGKIFFEDVGDRARGVVAKIMKERDIGLLTNKELVEITKESLIFSDGSEIPCDLAIVIPPYKAPKFIAKSNLGDDKGWIPTNKEMVHINYPNIFAAGDCTALAQPKLGHIAINQADVAVSSILKAEKIEHEEVKFNPEVFCIMNMGGFEATLIYSNVLFGGKDDLAWHSPIAKLMKTSFDEEYHFTNGHMPPDIMTKALESLLIKFKE